MTPVGMYALVNVIARAPTPEEVLIGVFVLWLGGIALYIAKG